MSFLHRMYMRAPAACFRSQVRSQMCPGRHLATMATLSRRLADVLKDSRLLPKVAPSPPFLCAAVPPNASFARLAQRTLATEAVSSSGGGLPTPALSAASSQAIKTIKETVQKTQRKSLQLTKAQKRSLQGNLRKYKLMGGRPEFHNVDVNRHGRIFEPWHTFEIVISSSKNNCWVTVKNKGRQYRTVFASHAGNVGFRKATRKTEAATYRIAQNVARKLKRLGVGCAEVTFRKVMKVETCLQAFAAHGLSITRLTHQPRLPRANPTKPRKQRRV